MWCVFQIIQPLREKTSIPSMWTHFLFRMSQTNQQTFNYQMSF